MTRGFSIARTLLLSALFILAALNIARADELNDKLDTLAQGLAGQIALAKLHNVGVPEFKNSNQQVLGGATGTAGRYFADQLQTRLVHFSYERFQMVERNRLQDVLQEGKFQVDGLTDPKSSQELLGKIRGLDGMVLGSLMRFDVTRTLEITCDIVRYPDAIIVGSASVRLKLDPDLLSLFGDNVLPPFNPAQNTQDRITQVMDEATKPLKERPAPHVDATAPVGIEILHNGQPKPLYQHDGCLLIPANKDEQYVIRLTNRTGRRVAVALFIDGLNTIGQTRDTPRGAIKWVLEADDTTGIVPGWQIDKHTSRQFVFAGGNDSLAARKHYTDQIGQITATFYPEDYLGEDLPQPDVCGVFYTKEGDITKHPTTNHSFHSSYTAPLGIITLRYDAADIVQHYEKAPVK